MTIIDADGHAAGHAADNEAAYRERLPEQYRRRSFIYASDGFDRHQNGKIQKTPKTPRQNLADNDRERIDVQIIYPTGGLMLSRVREPDYAIALAGTYNDWLHDWCSADPKRLKGVALVPLRADVRAAIHRLGHFENFLQIHTCSHAAEQLLACTAVIYSGLLETYRRTTVSSGGLRSLLSSPPAQAGVQGKRSELLPGFPLSPE